MNHNVNISKYAGLDMVVPLAMWTDSQYGSIDMNANSSVRSDWARCGAVPCLVSGSQLLTSTLGFMELSDFASLTQNVIRDDGFDDFIPVACLPGRREIRGLDGLPAGSDVEVASIDWATSLADETEEFLVAFKVTANQFKVVRRLNGVMESAVFAVVA
jgi:hypothetical protein